VADSERQLVSLVAQTGVIEKLIGMNIGSEHFADPSCRVIFETCAEHIQRWQTPPSFKVVREKHPDFIFETVTDSMEFIAERFKGEIVRRETIKAIDEIAGFCDDATKMPILDELLLEAARRVSQAVPSLRVSKYSDPRLPEYKRRKKDGSFKGINMGVPEFDKLTKGMQPHEYISVVGWQGTGKSTLAQLIAFNAYMQNVSPLFFSLEMEADALQRKFDILGMNHNKEQKDALPYDSLKGYTLTKAEEKKFEEHDKWKRERAEKAGAEIMIVDDIGKPTIDRVHAEIVRRAPGLVIVDYVSLMETPSKINSMWEQVTYLTKGLKRIARGLKVPVIGIAQTNINSAEEGAKLQNISYSRSIGQDSDIVLGLFQDEDMRKLKQMQLRMLKNRDGRIANCDFLWDLDYMHFRPWAGTTDMFKRDGKIGP
jgi:replicative DNA helicase